MSERLSEIVISCRNYYAANVAGGFPDNIVEKKLSAALRKGFLGKAIVYSAEYNDWSEDEDNPGYLCRLSGTTAVRVPFHLASAFPDENSLRVVLEASKAVKSKPESIMCLSGSSVMLKAAVYSGDLDFCEYIIQNDQTIGDLVKRDNLLRSRTLLTKLRVGKIGWELGQIDAKLDQVLSTKPDPTSKTNSIGKADFLHSSPSQRPIDVSNVMIFCDNKWKSASKHRTFTAQEALLDPSVPVPSDLCSPVEIGRYLDWLVLQVRHYLHEGNFTKVLKRLLPLSRITLMNKKSDEITSFISMSKEFAQKEVENIDTMIAEISRLSFSDRTNWLHELEIAKGEAELHVEKIVRRAFSSQTLADFATKVADEVCSVIVRA